MVQFDRGPIPGRGLKIYAPSQLSPLASTREVCAPHRRPSTAPKNKRRKEMAPCELGHLLPCSRTASRTLGTGAHPAQDSLRLSAPTLRDKLISF